MSDGALLAAIRADLARSPWHGEGHRKVWARPTYLGHKIASQLQQLRRKTEVIRRREPWRSLEAVEFATLEWVAWFNNRRLLEPIGNMTPAEAEERYYAQLQETALAA